MTANTTPETVSWHLPRLFTVWAFALIAAILVVLFVSGDDRYVWLSLTIGVSTLLSFVLQLGTAQREGFISRTSFSVSGAVLLVGLVGGITFLMPGS